MNKIDKDDLLDIKLFNIIENEILTDIEKEKQLLELAHLNNIDISKIYQRYFWLKQMDINPNVIHLRENHKIIYEIFGEYTKMLNDHKIEYYYTSGILSYLLVDKPLERYHHDLDIFINMNDLNKLESVCKNYNFSFHRKLGDRGDGTKRVMLKMYYKDMFNIPITVFMYVKEDDLSVIQKDYFTNENGNEFVECMYNSPDIARLSFSDIPHYYNNIKYYAISLEALYLCKNGNRPKDIYDCSFFADYIDRDKLKSLEEAFKINKPNMTVSAKEDGFYNFIFLKSEKSKVLCKK